MSNIIINNKEYYNVPSVTFNKVEGGTATYTEGGGGGTTIEQLNVAAAGTYTAPTGTAYSPVVVPSGSVGNPTATKSQVSGNAVTVTPSVTSTSGFISAGTHTGTSITVSASELVSGTKSITSNGIVDVTQYASASVSVPATPTSYLGTNPVKIADYTAVTTYLSSTPFTTWTPSTTALVIANSSNIDTETLDLANYDYCIIWTSESVFAYNSSAANVLKPVKQCHSIWQAIYRSPSNLTNLANSNYNANRCANLTSAGLIDYYNSSGSHTLTYSLNICIYPTSTTATFSSSTSNTPTMTIKTPSYRIACHNSYFSTDNAGKIDANNTYFKYWGELWRVDKDSAMLGMYKNIINAYNS